MKMTNCFKTGTFGRAATVFAVAVFAVVMGRVCMAQTPSKANPLVWKKPNVLRDAGSEGTASSDVAPAKAPDAPKPSPTRELPEKVDVAAMPDEAPTVQTQKAAKLDEAPPRVADDAETISTDPTGSLIAPPERRQQRRQPGPDVSGIDLILSAYEKTKTARREVDYSDIIELCETGLDTEASGQTKDYGRRLASWAYNRRGELLAKEGREVQALIDFEAAVRYDRTRWRAFHNRGVSHAMAARRSKAIADFSRTIELNPTYANAYFNRGEVKYDLGDIPSAIRDYDRAIYLSPNDSAARNSRGYAYYQLGKVKLAARDFTEAIKLDPGNSAAYTNRGELFADLGYYPRARKDFQKAVEANPKLGAAHLGMAWLLATCPDPQFRNPKNAVAAARLALELDGAATHQHLDTLAAAYASGGDFDSASAVLAQAIEDAPQGTTDQYRVRLALYEQGQPYLSQPRSIPSAEGEQATYGARPQPQESVAKQQPRSAPPTSATSDQTKPHRHLVPGSSRRGQ